MTFLVNAQFPLGYTWFNMVTLPSIRYVCGHCGRNIATASGYNFGQNSGIGSADMYLYICPSCQGPTLITKNGDFRHPLPAPGNVVSHVPIELSTLYNEARQSAGAGAFTSSVLTCRKILMHIAVDKGAKEGTNFVAYIEHLDQNGYIPPNGKGWVDYIRQRGNEANHEIVLMNEKDAEGLIKFVEMLLRFIYEFPQLVPPSGPTTT